MSPIHTEPHPLAGQTVTLQLSHDGLEGPKGNLRVEDWWDRVAGIPWGDANGVAAAIMYGIRSAFGALPTDDEVVYGHDDRGLGHIVHVSELGDPIDTTVDADELGVRS